MGAVVDHLHTQPPPQKPPQEESATESKCDFCEDEDKGEHCFDPDWDAFLCPVCSEELEKEMEEFRKRLSKHERD